MPLVHVGLGSNIDPEPSLRRAVFALRQSYGELIISPVYQSAPVGFEGGDFLNAVVGFVTNIELDRLGRELRTLETTLGRVRPNGSSWQPRNIDIDLLTYGSLSTREGTLQIPSPDILSYAFVLRPLADIAGDWPHPIDGRNASQLQQELDLSPAVTRLDLDLATEEALSSERNT